MYLVEKFFKLNNYGKRKMPNANRNYRVKYLIFEWKSYKAISELHFENE